jgi:predicted enzyme related to lactoylglutathione lyase
MGTPDGQGRIGLCRYFEPEFVEEHRNAPVNSLGFLRVMFSFDDIDATVARAREFGAILVSYDVIRYQDAHRFCYIRGPENLLIGLAEEL